MIKDINLESLVAPSSPFKAKNSIGLVYEKWLNIFSWKVKLLHVSRGAHKYPKWCNGS